MITISGGKVGFGVLVSNGILPGVDALVYNDCNCFQDAILEVSGGVIKITQNEHNDPERYLIYVSGPVHPLLKSKEAVVLQDRFLGMLIVAPNTIGFDQDETGKITLV